jgi:4a-hydroxytetrahydrobiopterin dehydratase
MYRYLSTDISFKAPALINSIKIFVRDFTDVPSISVSKLNTEEITYALDIH